MSDEVIREALDLMRATYPKDKLSLWIDILPGKAAPEYTAGVGAGGASDNPVFAWGDTPIRAVERLIDKAGHRDPEAMRVQRIRKLRAELSYLEGLPIESTATAA